MSWFMELHTLLTHMMLNKRREVEVRAEVMFYDSFDSLNRFPQSHLDSGSKKDTFRHLIRAVLQFLSCVFFFFLNNIDLHTCISGQQNVYNIFRFCPLCVLFPTNKKESKMNDYFSSFN